MKYIELISKTKRGNMGIKHSILQNGNTILSFENGIFKIYDKSYLKDRMLQKCYKIPSFDLKQYEGLKLDLTCFEALEYICKLEGINMNTGRLKTYLILALILIVTHVLIAILGIVIGLKLDKELVEAYVGERIGYYIFY